MYYAIDVRTALEAPQRQTRCQKHQPQIQSHLTYVTEMPQNGERNLSATHWDDPCHYFKQELLRCSGGLFQST